MKVSHVSFLFNIKRLLRFFGFVFYSKTDEKIWGKNIHSSKENVEMFIHETIKNFHYAYATNGFNVLVNGANVESLK